MDNNEGGLKPEIIEDLRQNTNFTEAEIKEQYESFMKDYPSGRLSFEEFQKIQSDFKPHVDSSEFAKRAFRIYDANRDGVIDFKEFLLVYYIQTRGTLEQKLKLLYKFIDINENGYVSREEMLVVVKFMHKILGFKEILENKLTPETLTEETFSRLDKNMDGLISLEDLIESAKSDPSIARLIECDLLTFRQP